MPDINMQLCHDLLVGDGIWLGHDGKRTPLRDMASQHIRNCIALQLGEINRLTIAVTDLSEIIKDAVDVANLLRSAATKARAQDQIILADFFDRVAGETVQIVKYASDPKEGNHP